MSWRCSVRIVDDEGNPKSGVDVTLFFFGLLAGHLSEYTDDDGWAEFELDTDFSPQNIERLAVNGEFVAEPGNVSDGETMSFTIG